MERSGPTLGFTPRLETRPGLRMLSFLALLPAGTVELDAVVERAVATNPLLERLPWRRCPTCGLATTAERCSACATAHWATEPVAGPDWRDELLQDAAAELPAAVHGVLELVVGSLDEHALLPDPPATAAETLKTVIDALRLVGPPGVAARSAVDCVRVQATALVAAGAAPALVARLAESWLPEVAEEQYADIARAEQTTEPAVRAAVEVLRSRTRPYVSLPGASPRSAPTDVVFTRPDRDGPVVAHVAGPTSIGIGLVHDLATGSAEARAWIAPHRDAADRLLAAIAARGHMLQRVADELARCQQAFIVDGEAMHAPVRRHEVATTLSVHASTVGRVVTGKVARCPDGRLVPLADFFGAAPSIRIRVAAALEAHPSATDRELADLLSGTGATIARRTVAKYRAQLTNAASPVH